MSSKEYRDARDKRIVQLLTDPKHPLGDIKIAELFGLSRIRVLQIRHRLCPGLNPVELNDYEPPYPE